MREIQGKRNDATVTVAENIIVAQAPATGAGFSDLILLLAQVHEKWRVPIISPDEGLTE